MSVLRFDDVGCNRVFVTMLGVETGTKYNYPKILINGCHICLRSSHLGLVS